MNNRTAWIVAIFAASFLLVGVTLGRRAERPAPTVSVELGRHLVSIVGCNDCHTPFKPGPEGPEPDMTRMLSGHPENLPMPTPPRLGEGPWLWIGAGTNTAFAGPWGVSYAANLTPDEDTGLGIWNEEMFVQTIRSGRHMGQSREIQPPMPWKFYRTMTDTELKSIYAFLRTIPPIKNRVPEYREPGAEGEDDFWARQ